MKIYKLEKHGNLFMDYLGALARKTVS